MEEVQFARPVGGYAYLVVLPKIGEEVAVVE